MEVSLGRRMHEIQVDTWAVIPTGSPAKRGRGVPGSAYHSNTSCSSQAHREGHFYSPAEKRRRIKLDATH